MAKRRNAAPIRDKKSHLAGAKVSKNSGSTRKARALKGGKPQRTEGITSTKVSRAK